MSKKKKIIFWTIGVVGVLIVLYLASVFFLCPKFSSMAQDQNYRSCSQDSDCVILRSDEGGCINKNNWVRLASYLCTSCGIFNGYGCLYPTSCTCDNSQCQAHFDNNYQSYDQRQEGVILTTDKTEYNKGDEIKITIKNNLDSPIEFWVIGIGSSDNWCENIRLDIGCPCGALCKQALTILLAGESKEFAWGQKGDDCNQVKGGKYIVRLEWIDPRIQTEVPYLAISKEFIIK